MAPPTWRLTLNIALATPTSSGLTPVTTSALSGVKTIPIPTPMTADATMIPASAPGSAMIAASAAIAAVATTMPITSTVVDESQCIRRGTSSDAAIRAIENGRIMRPVSRGL